MQEQYRLVIDLAGPGGYRDRGTIVGTIDEITPWPDSIDFERYGGPEDYVEYRKDLIVSRSLQKIEEIEENNDGDS